MQQTRHFLPLQEQPLFRKGRKYRKTPAASYVANSLIVEARYNKPATSYLYKSRPFSGRVGSIAKHQQPHMLLTINQLQQNATKPPLPTFTRAAPFPEG